MRQIDQLIENLENGISLIDLHDMGLVSRTGSYLLQGNDLTIIETSASPSIPFLLKGLEMLHVDPADIMFIIVTHIHLDHAGGVGLLIDKCPNATVVVHPKGKRHLIDPSKLIKGTKAVYGDEFDRYFNPVLSVPEHRLLIKKDGETLKIGENRILTFFDTPGHANHHFSIYDSGSNGIFTGDTTGVLYPQARSHGIELVLPSTSPNQFDPNAMLKSVERIENLDVDYIYFGHYGRSAHPENVYKQIRYWLPIFIEAGKQVLTTDINSPYIEQKDKVATRIFNCIQEFLDQKGIDHNDELYRFIELDSHLCAMGIIDYLRK